jgi:RNA polymerase primary sigma factor
MTKSTISFPESMVSSDQLDDVMSMFGEMDIEVVDSEQKVSLRKNQGPKTNPGEEESEEEAEFEAGVLGRTSDPVRMYLREMGQVSLLTREGEVEIAKRIEDGEALVTRVIMKTPIAFKEVIALGEKLVKGQISVAEITKEYEEEEGLEAEEKQRQRIVGLMEQIRTKNEHLSGTAAGSDHRFSRREEFCGRTEQGTQGSDWRPDAGDQAQGFPGR